ncbi:hypothetical protein G7Y89_g8348 [Cudoniella acicularis]|uniref:Uncharacterized protein n=1 Tax=Cudoniella acicularis TaxID=354080 RepID=A0A8H4RGS3_9HELO|nr:hypothetical protein G7Y89_g8348 [Cudoniella acicularis]
MVAYFKKSKPKAKSLLRKLEIEIRNFMEEYESAQSQKPMGGGIGIKWREIRNYDTGDEPEHRNESNKRNSSYFTTARSKCDLATFSFKLRKEIKQGTTPLSGLPPSFRGPRGYFRMAVHGWKYRVRTYDWLFLYEDRRKVSRSLSATCIQAERGVEFIAPRVGVLPTF